MRERHLASGKEPTYDEIEDSMSRKEDNRQITNSLECLPPRCRRIFTMSRLDEKKYAEIAVELGISVKT